MSTRYRNDVEIAKQMWFRRRVSHWLTVKTVLGFIIFKKKSLHLKFALRQIQAVSFLCEKGVL